MKSSRFGWSCVLLGFSLAMASMPAGAQILSDNFNGITPDQSGQPITNGTGFFTGSALAFSDPNFTTVNYSGNGNSYLIDTDTATGSVDGAAGINGNDYLISSSDAFTPAASAPGSVPEICCGCAKRNSGAVSTSS